MRYKKINELTVQGSDGSSIQIRHHDYLEYRSNEGVVQVTVGYEPTRMQILVYASEANTRETSSGTKDISVSDHQAIIDNLKEGLALLKGTFVVV